MVKQRLKSPVMIVGLILVFLILAYIVYSRIVVSSIADIKTEDHIGKNVRVRGEVTNVLKIGQLSGYTLEDASGTIAVSSEALPAEGDKITVEGTLIRDTLFGYYIKT